MARCDSGLEKSLEPIQRSEEEHGSCYEWHLSAASFHSNLGLSLLPAATMPLLSGHRLRRLGSFNLVKVCCLGSDRKPLVFHDSSCLLLCPPQMPILGVPLMIKTLLSISEPKLPK